ncbi:MAG TPA: glycosyltransferase family 2 protein [Prolixibacteraceae bacterium]|nr:glycosyltransferase family 2 protein [Prolixibacteraceae bacterium]
MVLTKKISIVVPCFNESDGIREFYKVITSVIENKYNYEIILVDDGSKDHTLKIIQELAQEDNHIKYISFSRNFGHQNAVKAGLDHASGDAVISLDADLQHPPQLIPQLIDKWQEGYEVVYTIREEHESISLMKKMTSRFFYKISNSLSETKVEPGAADFRLLDRKVVDAIKQMPENYLFLRGLIAWVGFKQYAIKYKANERFAGESKYTFKKMVKFASTGITSFSTKPLKISIYLGTTFALVAFAFAVYALIIYSFTDKAIQGWASIVIGIMFFSGINLLMLGIIGEYLGKMFIENKRRPNYIVGETNIDG